MHGRLWVFSFGARIALGIGTLAVGIAVALGFNLLGDGLQDALDPRLKE